MNRIGNKFHAKKDLDMRCCFVAVFKAILRKNYGKYGYLEISLKRNNAVKQGFLPTSNVLNFKNFQTQHSECKYLITNRLGNARSIR